MVDCCTSDFDRSIQRRIDYRHREGFEFHLFIAAITPEDTAAIIFVKAAGTNAFWICPGMEKGRTWEESGVIVTGNAYDGAKIKYNNNKE